MYIPIKAHTYMYVQKYITQQGVLRQIQHSAHLLLFLSLCLSTNLLVLYFPYTLAAVLCNSTNWSVHINNVTGFVKIHHVHTLEVPFYFTKLLAYNSPHIYGYYCINSIESKLPTILVYSMPQTIIQGWMVVGAWQGAMKWQAS